MSHRARLRPEDGIIRKRRLDVTGGWCSGRKIRIEWATVTRSNPADPAAPSGVRRFDKEQACGRGRRGSGHLARKHHPDLILMDIQLPEVSGLEVTKWLKDDPDLKVIPVVAVTAFAMKGDEERIREGGCEAYLSKPISVGKFLETVRHFLGTA